MMRFSDFEKKELAKAGLAISLAFTILFNGLNFGASFFVAFIISGFTVGLGFLLHEMAHKYFAQKYGAWAEFRANNQMLVLAIVFSFFGFILAAPGGVFIRGGHITKKRNGIISLAGPMTNVILAFIFASMILIYPFSFTDSIAKYGLMINALLAVFNMIPFGFFDGAKVWRWNKRVWLVGMVVAVVPMLLTGVF